MVIAEIKSLADINEMIKSFRKIFIVGCGECVSVCLTGGQKQVELLSSALRISGRNDKEKRILKGKTISRQCEPKFLEQINKDIEESDAVLSMACGAGVQTLSEKFRKIPVFPAMDTKFIGVSDEAGNFIEMCSACGDCILSLTGGICPVTRCPKGLLNGPCGGSKNGKCEANPETPCAWLLIYEKMKELNKLEELKNINNPKDWSKNMRPGKVKAGI